ncbi:hypothetical protein Q3C87_08155 [Enterococcus faecium]|uniref:hypothetical protein n=1 Tax=Enterococcus faecium TaxID=1352 RepID=UPI000CF5EEDB|nr:hypothetical protein [Enterococcus faecium]MDQ8229983.1 hypothetical protein [Enterococcus faecium]PQB99235.1 hypothetical protein CUN14_12850 [Enterococcus faecium]
MEIYMNYIIKAVVSSVTVATFFAAFKFLVQRLFITGIEKSFENDIQRAIRLIIDYFFSLMYLLFVLFLFGIAFSQKNEFIKKIKDDIKEKIQNNIEIKGVILFITVLFIWFFIFFFVRNAFGIKIINTQPAYIKDENGKRLFIVKMFKGNNVLLSSENDPKKYVIMTLDSLSNRDIYLVTHEEIAINRGKEFYCGYLHLKNAKIFSGISILIVLIMLIGAFINSILVGIITTIFCIILILWHVYYVDKYRKYKKNTESNQ